LEEALNLSSDRILSDDSMPLRYTHIGDASTRDSLRVFKNKVLRNIYVPKREEVEGDWRK
jgi:hypothetical protein